MVLCYHKEGMVDSDMSTTGVSDRTKHWVWGKGTERETEKQSLSQALMMFVTTLNLCLVTSVLGDRATKR